MVYSCVSPLDPDTPRNKFTENEVITPPINHAKIFAKSFLITVKENSSLWKFSITDTLIQIDTSTTPLRLWLQIHLKRYGSIPQRFPFLEEIDIRVDSVQTTGEAINIISDSSNVGGPQRIARYTYGSEKDSSGKIHYITVQNYRYQQAPTSITLHHESSSRSISGELLATINPNQKSAITIDGQITIKY